MDFTCLPWLRLETQELFHMHWMAGERVNSGCWGAAPSASSLASRLSLSAPWSASYQASISGFIYFHSYLVYLKACYLSSQILAHI